VSDTTSDAAELAAAVSAARDRMIEFAGRCPVEKWTSRPLADGDPRPVGVIVDHVADAYEYLGSWVTELARGETVDVTPAAVDELNARHASAVTAPTREAVIEHLRGSGDEFVALVVALRPEQMSGSDGHIVRFADIAARHADAHRAELEEALGLW